MAPSIFFSVKTKTARLNAVELNDDICMSSKFKHNKCMCDGESASLSDRVADRVVVTL